MVTKAHTPSEARASIRLINVAKQLFSLGLVVHVACPLQELFSVQHGRLMDIVSESIISGCDTEASDTASDVTDTREWEELVDDLGKLGATLKREDWCYDVVSKEWKPVDHEPTIPLADSSDYDTDADSLTSEAEFIFRRWSRTRRNAVAAARVQTPNPPTEHEQAQAEAQKQKEPTRTQATMGAFFGNAITKKYARVTLPDGRVQKQLVSAEATALPRYAHTERSWAASCPKGCGKKFAHGPALAAHVKACYFYNELNVPTRGEELSEEEDEPAVQTTEDATILEDSASDCAPEEQQPGGVGFKRRKDGTGFKRTGLQEGQRRGRSHTIHFKYEVVQHYRSLQAMKQRGLLGMEDLPPVVDTAETFKVSKGQVSTWAKMEGEFRKALQHGSNVKGKGKRKNDGDTLVAFKTRAARRTTLHQGRKRPFASAEAELHANYKEKRSKGLPVSVSAQFLRITYYEANYDQALWASGHRRVQG